MSFRGIFLFRILSKTSFYSKIVLVSDLHRKNHKILNYCILSKILKCTQNTKCYFNTNLTN